MTRRGLLTVFRSQLAPQIAGEPPPWPNGLCPACRIWRAPVYIQQPEILGHTLRNCVPAGEGKVVCDGEAYYEAPRSRKVVCEYCGNDFSQKPEAG